MRKEKQEMKIILDKLFIPLQYMITCNEYRHKSSD